jgi:hypothetical protein
MFQPPLLKCWSYKTNTKDMAKCFKFFFSLVHLYVVVLNICVFLRDLIVLQILIETYNLTLLLCISCM